MANRMIPCLMDSYSVYTVRAGLREYVSRVSAAARRARARRDDERRGSRVYPVWITRAIRLRAAY